MEKLKKLYLSEYFIEPLANIILDYLRNEYVVMIENMETDIAIKFINYSINKEEVKKLIDYIREVIPRSDPFIKLDINKIVDEEFVDNSLKFKLFDFMYKIDQKISLPNVNKTDIHWEDPILEFIGNLGILFVE